jgi:hypothetical protein
MWMLDHYGIPAPGRNVKHFHKHLQLSYGRPWRYSWNKTKLQYANLVPRPLVRATNRIAIRAKTCSAPPRAGAHVGTYARPLSAGLSSCHDDPATAFRIPTVVSHRERTIDVLQKPDNLKSYRHIHEN